MKNKSFTLIELLVVIVIIGILAGVIIVSVSSSINKANFAKAQSFSNTVQNELLGDLVSEWTFDEILSETDQPIAGNTLIDDDYGNNNLYTQGGIVLRNKEDCIKGTCLDFINDSETNLNRIYRDDEFNFSSADFTISYWINKRWGCRYNNNVYTNDGWTGIIEILNPENGKGAMFHAINKGNQFVIKLFFEDDTSTGDVYFPTNKDILNDWHFITFSYSGSNVLKIYIDGEVSHNDFLGAGKTLRVYNNMKISIGNVSTYWLKGKLDEFKYYDIVLSTSQIKQEYIAGLNSLLANNSISKEEYDKRLNSLAQK